MLRTTDVRALHDGHAAGRAHRELEATLTTEHIEPHYNIAPTMDAPIVVQSKEGGRRLGLARFGLSGQAA